MTRRTSGHVALLVAVIALAWIGPGCRPLVGIRARIRLDDRTRLEREVLGTRGQVPPQGVLLRLMTEDAEPEPAEEVRLRDAELVDLQSRLDAVKARDAWLRSWQVIVLHNRAVLRARLGDREGAAQLLEAAAERARLYALPTLLWQVQMTAAELDGRDSRWENWLDGGLRPARAAILSATDYALEDSTRRGELYERLVRAALDAGRAEDALRLAAEREATDLARSAPPGALAVADGPLADATRELDRARSEAAEARGIACSIDPENVGTSAARVQTALQNALDALEDARAALTGLSPAGGLIVPDPVDVGSVRETLTPGTALLVYEPTGADEYAAFALTPEAFRAERVFFPASTAARASVVNALAERVPPQGLDDAGRLLLSPFEDLLTADVTRLYLALPASLHALAWQSLPLDGVTLAERFNVAFLGGLSDLQWGFRQKRFGRREVLVTTGWPSAGAPVAQALSNESGVRAFDVGRRGKRDLLQEARLADMLWLGNPVRLLPNAPVEGHVAFPGELERAVGITLGDLAAARMGASCVAFANVPPSAYGSESAGALRALVRAAMAGGVPSIACGLGADAMPAEASTAYWTEFIRSAREGSAAQAHRVALAKVEPRWREAFRLFGFAGMNDAEFAEFATLEFGDVLRAAMTDLAAGRAEQAAAGFIELARMAEARPVESEADRSVLLANIEQYIVKCWDELRRYDRATQHQLARIDHLVASGQAPGPLMAVEYQSLGALLTKAERFAEAAEAYQRSIELLRGSDGAEALAAALGELGKGLDRASEYQQALDTFAAALEQYRELAQPGGQALQHRRMGAIYLRRLNNAVRAEEQFRHALDIYEIYEAEPAADGIVEARIDLGLCRRALGDLKGALDLFEAALADAERDGLADPAARVLTEIANTRWLRGEYDDALRLLARSDELIGPSGSAFQRNVNRQLEALIYWELNHFDRAHRALDRAIEAAKEAEEALEVASAYNNHGIVYRRQKLYERALEAFGKARAIDERLGTRWGLAYDHRNVGMTLHRMGRREEASPELERAVELSRDIGDRVNLAKALLALGDLRLDQQRPDEAATALDEALAVARLAYLPEVEWRALRGQGRLHRAHGNRDAALQAFTEGVQVVERLRTAIKVEELRSGFLANKADLYEDVVRLLLDMGRPAEAFAYSERARARKFIDVVSARQIELKTDRERDLYARLHDLALRLRGLNETLCNESDAGRRRALASQIDQLAAEYADAVVDIQAANPALSGFVTVEAVEPGDLAGALPADVPLLVYYTMQDELVLWVLRAGKLSLRRVTISREDLESRVRDYRLMVQNRELLGDVRRASTELHALIVQPVRDLLADSRAVGIVPHGPMHYLSFASLHDGQAFLVERYPLFYAPSASVLRRTLSAPPPGDKERMTVLAMGNPAVGDAAYELPFTEREVVSIQRDFAQVTPLLGRDASEDRLRENAEGFDIIHIGAHGRFDPLNPLFSSLLLAPAGEDGVLHLHEVTGLRMNAQLATLSACQSGLGTLTHGDELVGLGRAFSYAGARAILSTLWRVDDVATALTLKHFYRRYATHGAAESLRHAQLQVMNDGRHYHPAYWAGVVLSGDYR